jgi:K+-sensing histidine kinase KdpD
LTNAGRAAWAIAACVVGVVAVLVAVLVRDAGRHRDARDAVATAFGGTLAFAGLVDDELAELERSATGALLDADELPDVVADAADDALASGEPRLSAAHDVDGAVVVTAVVARVAPGTPPSTEARRAALLGFATRDIDVGGLADAAYGGAEIELRQGDRVLAPREEGMREVVSRAIRVAGQDFEVVVLAPGGTDAVAVAALVVGLALAAGVGVVGTQAARARRRQADEAAAAAARSSLIVDSGSVLQRSLDLGEVLPALGVRIAESFDLLAVEIRTVNQDGALRPVFTMGPPTDDASTTAVPLERHGRTIGELRVRPAGVLDEGQRATLRAIGELTASAIANVNAFEDEQEAVRRLAELDQLKTDFLATVSHELLTPVTAIKGFSTLLVSSWERIGDEERLEQLARIARNADSLAELVRGLLEFARMERRSLQVDLEDHDLSALVRAAVDQTANLLTDRAIEVDAPAPVTASVDAYAVERIVVNLLTNAGKFSPPGTPVGVRVWSHDGRAVLAVTDHGTGIAPEERARIFSRFYRGTGERVISTRGAGVGLAVVKELVDRMGATIAVTETAGGGATFTVSFEGVAAG